MSRLVLIAPVPTSITSDSNEESLYPDEHVSNCADWFIGVLGLKSAI